MFLQKKRWLEKGPRVRLQIKVMYSAEEVEELLLCPICLDRVEKPKVLPCQHAFCLDCLVSHGSNKTVSPGQNRTVDCPTCRQRTTLPKQAFSGLPDCLLAKNLMDLSLVEKEKRKPKLCPSCNENGSLKKCEHCSNQLCGICIGEHREFMVNCISTTLVLMNSHLTGPNVAESLVMNKKKLLSLGATLVKEKASMLESFDRLTKTLEVRKSDLSSQFERLDRMRKMALNYAGNQNYEDAFIEDTKNKANSDLSDSEVNNLKKDVYEDFQWLKLVTDTAAVKDNNLKFRCSLPKTAGDGSNATTIEEVLRSVGVLEIGGKAVCLDKYKDKLLEGMKPVKKEVMKKIVKEPSPVPVVYARSGLVRVVSVEPARQVAPSPQPTSRPTPLARTPLPPAHTGPGHLYLAKARAHHPAILGDRGNIQLLAPMGATYGALTKIITVACSNERGIMLVHSDGSWTKSLDEFYCGYGGRGSISLRRPLDVAREGQSFVFTESGTRQQITRAQGAELWFRCGSRGTQPGQFLDLCGVSIHLDMIVAVDAELARISLFSLDSGHLVRYFGARFLCEPRYVAIDASNQLYVSDDGEEDVKVFNWGGKFLRSFGRRVGGGASGIVVDSSGFVCVARPKLGFVDVYNPNGDFHCVFGRGQGRGVGCLSDPRGLALLPGSKILVCDAGNNRLQVF